MPQISELLRFGIQDLQSSSPTARLDAELLLAFVLESSRSNLIVHSSDLVAADQERCFRTLLERRKAGEPIAYLTGRKEFWGLEFEVGPGVLIPRPETELLVERSWEVLAARSGFLNILDLGTGSGCIAAALAVELQKAGRSFELTASDRNPAALAFAQRNIARLGLGGVVEVAAGAFFEACSEYAPFDLIVSNPPYIQAGDREVSRETAFEPETALYAGPSGFEVIERLILEAPSFLKEGGTLLFEIGCKQAEAVRQLVARLPQKTFSSCVVFKDLAGLDRAVRLQKGVALDSRQPGAIC